MNINLTNQELEELKLCVFEKISFVKKDTGKDILLEDIPLMTALDKIINKLGCLYISLPNTDQEK